MDDPQEPRHGRGGVGAVAVAQRAANGRLHGGEHLLHREVGAKLGIKGEWDFVGNFLPANLDHTRR